MRWGTLGCLLVGCGFDASGLGGRPPDAPIESSDDDGSSETSTTAQPELDDEDDEIAESSGEPPDAPVGTESSTTSEAPEASSTGANEGVESCAAVLLADPEAPDGVYVLDTPTGTVEAYCDMTTDGGGWMLVARSAPTDPQLGGFGWNAAGGDLDDLAAPYSLGVLSLGVPIHEILLGDRGDGMQWGAHVYRLQLPSDFADAMDASATPPQSITTVVGDCAPDDGPQMLRRLGHTGRENVFFFRDAPDFAEYGLLPTGFDTYWEVLYRCSRGADLHADQGMIFVR